ncbi:MAG: MCP four helix bundle domain-containing protein, partial [Proteobacteria bacterium]|nr:MCP four helix bundle domain-containing protein [Pseudomonadota bacterium]
MRMTIRVKLIGGFLIVVGMLLIVAVVGFNGVNKVADGADGISRSAALDDAAMNMTIALQRGMDAESLALISGYTQEVVDQFNASIEQFDEAEGVIDALGTDQQKILLEELAADHENFQKAVLTSLSLEQATKGQSALLSVNGSVGELFTASADVVGALVASPTSTSAQLDQAGAQRMRAYKMAFLANSYALASGDHQTTIADDLVATISGFNAVKAGLRNGDLSRSRPGQGDAPGRFTKKALKPARRRDVASYLCGSYRVSERRA